MERRPSEPSEGVPAGRAAPPAAARLRGVRLGLSAVAVALVAGCGPRGAETRAAPAPRLVSVAPALTSIVVALGAADHLVGVTRHCDVGSDVGEAASPAVIGDFEPIPERVLAARPDRVLMADYASQRPAREALEALGLEVGTYPLLTLDDLRATTRALGELLGRAAPAARLEAAIDAALRELAAWLPAGPRPRWAVIYGTEPGFVYTTGGGDHIAELLGHTGAANALAGHPRSARLGLERILEAAPDLILHVSPTAGFTGDAAARAFWARWDAIPAVRHGAVFVFPDDRLARNGPHLATVAAPLCTMLRAAAEALR